MRVTWISFVHQASETSPILVMGRCKFLVSIKEAFAAVFSPKPCNKPLEPYRQSLILLCAHPPDESSDKRQKIVRITFTVIVLTVKTSIFIGCLIYCYEFFSIDFKRCVLAFMGAGTTFSTIYMTIVAITQRYKVAAIFEDLSTIYNSCKCCWFQNRVEMNISFF